MGGEPVSNFLTDCSGLELLIQRLSHSIPFWYLWRISCPSHVQLVAILIMTSSWPGISPKLWTIKSYATQENIIKINNTVENWNLKRSIRPLEVARRRATGNQSANVSSVSLRVGGAMEPNRRQCFMKTREVNYARCYWEVRVMIKKKSAIMHGTVEVVGDFWQEKFQGSGRGRARLEWEGKKPGSEEMQTLSRHYFVLWLWGG